MAEFRIVSPTGEKLQPVPLDHLPKTIGRADDADLRLDDSSVSKYHGEVSSEGGRIWIRELGSLNGIWVNGRRIEDKAELKSRDRIMVGDYELEFLN